MQMRWLAGLAAAVAIATVVVAIAGCPPRNTSQPVPPPEPTPGYEPPPPGDPPPRPPATGAPAGAACNAADDCASRICEGEGCGAGQGSCAAEQRACTFDLVAYCGCDGQTFQASGGCPNKRFQHRGACKPTPPTPPPKPAGAACLAAAECSSGVCEGHGCGPDAPGVCAEKARACTRDRRAYCGCDGVTFFSSGSCPGRRYSARSSCPTP